VKFRSALDRLQALLGGKRVAPGVWEMASPGFSGVAALDDADARVIKSAFSQALAAHPSVERAYFCSLEYDGGKLAPSLFLVPHNPDPLPVLEAMASVIKSYVSRDVFVDIRFLPADIESRVAKLCPPFYTRLS
jgi:type III secretion system (T3SS) SseB-like protein